MRKRNSITFEPEFTTTVYRLMRFPITTWTLSDGILVIPPGGKSEELTDWRSYGGAP